METSDPHSRASRRKDKPVGTQLHGCPIRSSRGYRQWPRPLLSPDRRRLDSRAPRSWLWGRCARWGRVWLQNNGGERPATNEAAVEMYEKTPRRRNPKPRAVTGCSVETPELNTDHWFPEAPREDFVRYSE